MAVTLDRWGFAEQLVRKHDLETWARSLLHMPFAEVEEASGGIRLRSKPRLGLKVDEAIIVIQPDLNQIALVHVRARNEKWRPQWDWLT